MKKFLPVLLLLLAFIFCVQKVHATQYFIDKQQSKGTTVSATVGQYHLSISGYQSPYATIVLTTKNGVFLRSTVADSKGYFTITDVLITDTTYGFCLQAIDFKRIGESDACIDFKGPLKSDITYSDIFLPPTIGLSKKVINAGQDALIYGYSMPNATVYLTIEGKTVTLTTDATGFYQYTYKNVPAGVYRFTATGELNGKKSLPPTNKAVLEVLSLPKQLEQETTNIAQNVTNTIPQDIAFFAFLALLLLIAIGVLLYKLRFRLWVIFIDFLRRRHKMHHDWFLDRWD